jgi:hypothetical protein
MTVVRRARSRAPRRENPWFIAPVTGVGGPPRNRAAWQLYGLFALAIIGFPAAPLLLRGLVFWGWAVDGLLWVTVGLLVRANRGGVGDWWGRTLIEGRHWEGRVSVEALRLNQGLVILVWGAALVLIALWLSLVGKWV